MVHRAGHEWVWVVLVEALANVRHGEPRLVVLPARALVAVGPLVVGGFAGAVLRGELRLRQGRHHRLVFALGALDRHLPVEDDHLGGHVARERAVLGGEAHELVLGLLLLGRLRLDLLLRLGDDGLELRVTLVDLVGPKQARRRRRECEPGDLEEARSDRRRVSGFGRGPREDAIGRGGLRITTRDQAAEDQEFVLGERVQRTRLGGDRTELRALERGDERRVGFHLVLLILLVARRCGAP
mmetsp:Transcript_6153/g.15188  ORF Transcript_6153/g.15188 Transcript_6153/m.15188 type:complete len:241 (-) Transcript_6153:79-801(-)